MNESQVQHWLDRLIDGDAVDWQEVEQALGAGSPELLRLRRLARLCSALAASRQVRPAEAAEAGAGFGWGHLRVRGRIGAGSSGEVFDAFDTVLERDVALKLLRGDDAVQPRAFIAEARRLAQVRHPNVLAVYGAAVHGGRAGMWSDRIVGVSLRERVAAGGPMDWDEVLPIGEQLVGALQAVHGAGLVHGDLKPANVMREQDSGRIVLMDFGSAASRAEAQRFGLLGSPLAMAPEQLRGESAGPAVDLYGLGAVLFHLCTGRLPVDAADLATLRNAHARDLARESALALPLPKTPRLLLADLLAADPVRRPDLDSVQRRLEFMRSAPVRRRRRWLVSAVIGSLGLGLAMALAGLHQAATERDRAQAAGAEQAAVSAFLADLLAAPNVAMEGADVRVRDVLDGAVAGLDRQFDGHPAARVRALMTVGNSYRSLGLHAQAEPLLAEALALAQRLYPADSEAVLDIESVLVHVRSELPDTQQPQAAIESVLARAQKSLGPQHRITVYLMLALAATLQEQDHVQRASGLLEQVLAVRPAGRDDGTVDSQRLAAMHRLGGLAIQQGNSEAAERWLRQALAEYESARPSAAGYSNHFAARGDLVRLLIDKGDLMAAEAESRRLLAEAETLFGASHGNVRVLLGNLGGILNQQRRFSEAVPYLERGAALVADHDPPGSWRRLTVEGNLANALAETGDLERARALRERAYEVARIEYGPTHPATLIMHNNLAEQRLLDGRADEALTLAEAMAGHAHERFGDSHLFTLEGSEVAARARFQLGVWDTALAELSMLCGRKSDSLGIAHPNTLSCHVHHAEALVAAGRVAQARTELQSALEACDGEHGPAHPLGMQIRAALAALPGD